MKGFFVPRDFVSSFFSLRGFFPKFFCFCFFSKPFCFFVFVFVFCFLFFVFCFLQICFSQNFMFCKVFFCVSKDVFFCFFKCLLREICAFSVFLRGLSGVCFVFQCGFSVFCVF